MNTTPRFLLQDLVKQAQASAMDRARIAKEAAHQMKLAEGDEDESDEDKKKKEKDSCMKTGSADEVTTEYAMKLAGAVEFIIPHLAKTAAPNAPPPKMTEKTVEPGKGPGATEVLESNVGGQPPGPGEQGKAIPKDVPPTSIGTQKSTEAGPSTQIDNTINEPPGGSGEQTTAMPAGKGKTAEAVYQGNLEVLRKMAYSKEDIAALETKALPGEGEQLAHLVGQGARMGYYPGAMLGALGGTALGGAVGTRLGEAAGERLMAAGHPILGGLAEGSGVGLGALGGGITGALGGGSITAGMGGALGAAEHGLRTKAKQDVAAEAEKEGSAVPPIVEMFLATIKQAEDAINPAHISAGPAVPPDTSQAEEKVPPKPEGSSMVGSNEGAINYTKQQAKAEPKRDMSSYVSEPALSSAHDSTLQQAFSHTGDAGVKMSSADAAMQVSRARALLETIAAAANK